MNSFKKKENNSPILEIKYVPNYEVFKKDDFFIYAGTTWDTEVQTNSKGNVSIKGKMQELQLGIEYKAKIQLDKVDPNYGASYNVVAIYQDIPDNQENQRYYLSTMMTDNQLKALLVRHGSEDIVQLFRDNKIDYKNIYGWSEKRYNKIRKKIMESLDYRDMFVYLGKYEISHDIIKKLIGEFGSAEKAIHEINKDVYALTRVPGIGFKKADGIAMSMGLSREDKGRIRAAIRHVIGENEINGDTYMIVEEMISVCHELLKIDPELIREQVNQVEGTVLFDERIARRVTYNAEHNIATKIRQMADRESRLDIPMAEFLFKMEQKYKKELPSGFTDEQREFFFNFKEHAVNILAGSAGCVDMETEFFNGERWKKISEYEEEDKVLQYNADGTTELVYPQRYIKAPETKLTIMKNMSGSINQCLSDDHNVIYRSSKGNLNTKPFHELKQMHETAKQGFSGRFYTTFEYSGKGIELTNDQIRLMCAIICDGHFPTSWKNLNNYCRINIKKERKKERLRILLSNCNIEYKEEKKKDGYSVFTFYCFMKTKIFDSYWYQCTKDQITVIAEEILFWDGNETSKNRKSFSTTVKENADFIQFVFSSTGRRSTLYSYDRTGQEYNNSNYIRKSVEHTVIISEREPLVSMTLRRPSNRTEFKEITPIDGFKYCFTLDSGMWVMRREGRICITGNSGKSAMQKVIQDLAKEMRMKIKYLSPTGKAAKVLSKYTGVEAYTIHRAIGYGRNVSEEESAQFELHDDILVIDEWSMVDVFLCSALLDAIKNPNVRIIMVGDNAQIASVNAGNILHDMINSGVVWGVELTKVWRQDEGGILDIATRIRKGQPFLNNTDHGKNNFGKNLIIHCVDGQHIESGYLHYYNLFRKEYNPEDIMVLSPTKKNNLGTIRINKLLQQINNPDDGQKQLQIGEDSYFRVGDYVMNTKNEYSASCSDGFKTTTIVNGDTGYIYDIVSDWNKKDAKTITIEDDDEIEQSDMNGIYVDFGFEKVIIPFDSKNNLMHAWAISFHKCQGSASKVIISILDKAHKFMGNRNLLYTGMTRATEKEVLLTQAETVNFVMRKQENYTRKTLLQEMLREEL